jgi:hypothetical protein
VKPVSLEGGRASARLASGFAAAQKQGTESESAEGDYRRLWHWRDDEWLGAISR